MPGDGIEREFKAMLQGSAERERLMALVRGDVRVLQQRNLLFDTADRRLAAARLSLRLRHEDALWVLTAKGPADGVSATGEALLTNRPEAEREIRPALAMHLAAGTADPLALLRRAHPAAMALRLADAIEAAAFGAAVTVVGEFRNQRTLCAAALPCGTPVNLAFDRSEMPDGSTEHELELEISPAVVAPAAAWLSGLLRQADIPVRPAASKSQRFSRALARRDALRRMEQ